jgi:hypothetical protein
MANAGPVKCRPTSGHVLRNKECQIVPNIFDYQESKPKINAYYITS